MKRFKRRTWILLGVLVIAAVAAVSGYAYFAAAGSGTGTATVATIGGPTIANDPPVGALWPDSVWHSMNVAITNPNPGNLYVTSISGTVANNGGCLGSWFEVQTIPVAGYIAPGTTYPVAGSVRMLFNNAIDQSVCSGTPMTINWTSN